MLNYFIRLPSPLGWGAALFARSAEVDFVDASEAIFDGGVRAVALDLVLAGAAGVFQVFGKAVRPAVEEGGVIAHVGGRGLTCLLCGGSDG